MDNAGVGSVGVNGALQMGVIGSSNTINPFAVNNQHKNDGGATAPLIAIVKRNGTLVPFRQDRIANAIEAAFRATKKIPASDPLPKEIFTTVNALTAKVVDLATSRVSEASLTVEGIQDLVERVLMEAGELEVVRNYIIYRDEHKQIREDSPRNMRVVRRDGRAAVRFNPMKIAAAVERAFRASLKIEDATPQYVIDGVNRVTNRVVASCVALVKKDNQIHLETIQDEVERQLMAEGFYQVAKDYILYRASRAALRSQALAEGSALDEGEFSEEEQRSSERRQLVLKSATDQRSILEKSLIIDTGKKFEVTLKDGTKGELSEAELRRRITFACQEYESAGLVSSEELFAEAQRNFYPGIKLEEVDAASTMAARAKVEKEPAYAFVAARILLDVIYRETFECSAHAGDVELKHSEYFKSSIKRGVEVERMAPELLQFDLDKLSKALILKRDQKFAYLGLQTLYDRYLIHHNDRKLETPQVFWMRVAMGLSINEGERKNERAIEFYDVLSQFLFTSSTPTLFNAGTLHPQLSSCYLTTVKDDLAHIFKCVTDDALLSKWAGGLGNDWTSVRATGARIKGTNGRSQGVIPFLKVANDTAVAVNQGGKRKGAMCAYLETWHLDIEDFLDLRKNTGDERRRTHDMNTANWIPDLFMKRVAQNGQWTLFNPSDVPDLHDLYGRAFETRYAEYEAMVERGEIVLFKKIEAVGLWRKILSMLFETGHPWVTFKDPSNIRSPQDHVGVVHSSNLCTEILLNTSAEETAVCNLGSINLLAHTTKNGLQRELLAQTVRTAVRMLDNVIDINFYPTPEARTANMRHRPIGLGFMGFQDALYMQGISYASPEAVKFADESMEAISYYAILSSAQLAEERGSYQSYKGSKWDRGLLPIDTVALMIAERGSEFVEVDSSASMDWTPVRAAIKKHGMRNSNTMAIAPTATISNITGVTQSIEPAYKNLYAKSNLSGEFIIHNNSLVEELKALSMWDEDMIDDLKYFDGSILEIERIPERVKSTYVTAFEIEPEWLIECASRRQKWIDMGQSLNLYIAEPSGKKLHDMYMLAWKKGLKTTYYLRSLGATQIEKSTTDVNRRGVQPRWMKNKSASSDVKIDREEVKEASAMPKVCGLDGDCESCQ